MGRTVAKNILKGSLLKFLNKKLNSPQVSRLENFPILRRPRWTTSRFVINQNKELLDKCTQAKEARKLNCCITSVCKLLSSGKRSITTIFAIWVRQWTMQKLWSRWKNQKEKVLQKSICRYLWKTFPTFLWLRFSTRKEVNRKRKN